jgi:hypothetical protein
MNERFEELAEQAGFDVKRLLAPYPGGFPREDLLALESFAELIVRECANLCQQEADKEFNNAWERVRAACDAQMILTHFGVEE